jgi:large subunit ribosomal protein L1
MARMSKKMKQMHENLDRSKEYDLGEAVEIVRQSANQRNFDETVELAMNLGVDPRHADQIVRGMVELPHGTGRSVRVAVFARDDKAEEARQAGADVVGAEDLVEQVQSGDMPFERCIATPDMMPLIGKLGKVLGPRGMMPNPKLGTVTQDVKGAIESAKGGAVEFRVEKNGIIQARVGKASFTQQQLVENAHALADAVARAKPAGAKGTYMKKATLSSTMGPGVKVAINSLLSADNAQAA